MTGAKIGLLDETDVEPPNRSQLLARLCRGSRPLHPTSEELQDGTLSGTGADMIQAGRQRKMGCCQAPNVREYSGRRKTSVADEIILEYRQEFGEPC